MPRPKKEGTHYERNRERLLDYASQHKKEKRVSDPLYHKGKKLRERYGITLDDYFSMFVGQASGCATCGLMPDEGKWLYVDHNHETGAVRALLCNGCNTALGYGKESPGVLRSLAIYIEHHEQLPTATDWYLEHSQ